MTIHLLKPGTREGRVQIRTPQGIASTAGQFIRNTNPKNWKRGRGDFYCFTGLYCSLRFSQPPLQMQTGLHLGKGKDSALFSKVRILSYMQYVLQNKCCLESQSQTRCKLGQGITSSAKKYMLFRCSHYFLFVLLDTTSLAMLAKQRFYNSILHKYKSVKYKQVKYKQM